MLIRGGGMGHENDNSASNCLRKLIASDLDLARVYVTVARAAYKRHSLNEVEFARLKAVKFYRDALHSVLQINKSERQAFLNDLEALRTKIEWLSMKSDAAGDPSRMAFEKASIDELLRLVHEAA